MTELDLPMDGDSEDSRAFPALFSRQDLTLLKFNSEMMKSSYEEEKAFSPVLFSQVSLPYKNPVGSPATWSRKNGDVTLKITPFNDTDESTGVDTRHYPHGVIPRLLIAYLTTEAVRTKNRSVDFGESLGELMRILDLKPGGRSSRNVRDQLKWIFGSSFEYNRKITNRAGSGDAKVYFQFAESWTDWTPSAEKPIPFQRAPWQNEVVLSTPYFDEIVDRRIPLDMNALRALGGSPMSMDIYLWISHRMSFLEAPSKIRWETLEEQFGSQYKLTRQFRHRFLENLQHVKMVYEGLNVSADEHHFTLKPSPTPIKKLSVGRFRAIGS